MNEKLTEKSLKIIDLAKEEAHFLQHGAVDTEHLLLGILNEGTSLGASVLKNLGVTLIDARREVERLDSRREEPTVSAEEVSLSAGARRALKVAVDVARENDDNYIGTGHLLMGLLRLPECGEAIRVLNALGVEPEVVSRRIGEMIGGTALVRSPADAAELRLPAQKHSPDRQAPPPALPLPASRPVVFEDGDDLVAGEVAARLSAFLIGWVDPRRLGRVIGASSSVRLPTGDTVRLDVAYFARDAELRLPVLAVEVIAPHKPRPALQAKLQYLLALGVRTGLLVDPATRSVAVLRHQEATRVLSENEPLSIPEALPGWELPLAQLWPRV